MEKAFDSVLTKDDLEATEEGRQDLAGGSTKALPQVKARREPKVPRAYPVGLIVYE